MEVMDLNLDPNFFYRPFCGSGTNPNYKTGLTIESIVPYLLFCIF